MPTAGISVEMQEITMAKILWWHTRPAERGVSFHTWPNPGLTKRSWHSLQLTRSEESEVCWSIRPRQNFGRSICHCRELKTIGGGYSICIDQFWFGHRCKKKTLLYIVGVAERHLPDIPIRYDAITHIIGTSGRRKDGKRASSRKEVSKKEREATPEQLAQWLLETARLTRINK